MNSAHINSKNVTFEELITIIRSKKTNASLIVGIAGGSASGKTTIARCLSDKFEDSLLLSQDLFQLGKDFSERKTSLYKWDDPKNFDLEHCEQTLSALKEGEAITVPTFDVIANRRIGTIKLNPVNYIFWEGVYALGSAELVKNIDLPVYIDTPFEIRLLRRIKRFFATRKQDQIEDASIPARQMLTFVWQAEKVYGAAQREAADYCITFNSTDIQAEIQDFLRQMKTIGKQFRTPIQGEKYAKTSWHGLDLVVKTRSFEIYEKEICLYAGVVDPLDIATISKNMIQIYSR